ncbi:cellulose synthase catalytic subunit [Yersinia frederiksenii]|uniref:UDP-forming cellulose synthase catalytic subunit n=1 Tax=Yersinia frederiksenii TaxID=29484 RepID=UPI0005E87CA2|nr:UDP-forming cellulose synthase catalytic subunit [Yersinia frederiksenii]CNC70945.1 cellulose synthase catalytic subunit [Yersinia frederiksenii]
MNRLMRMLFLTPVYQGMRRRYHHYMQQGCTVLRAFLTTLIVPLCWVFLRLESPSWQSVIQHRTYWFPQISPNRPRLGDSLRYLLQGIWLLLTRPASLHEKRRQPVAASKGWVKNKRQGYISWLGSIPERFELQRIEQSVATRLSQLSRRTRRILFILLGIFTGILALLCISQPFGMLAQFVFVLLLWAIAMVVRRVPGRFPTLMLIVLSLTVSCRYLWWRYTETLNWDDPVSLVCGLLLLLAETYAWIVLVLGYFQTIWPLNRQPVPMPDDINSWPTIDLMVPTYNEDLGVVKPTIYAALGIDWPKDKINIYLLDDGNRPAFKAFAAEVGVHYIARPTHEHAKAGNINNALKQATGEFVAIFDCDHVPTRSFLQLTVGWFFKDKKLGMIQTPHHFFSPDPFERNLGRFRQTPNEGTLFYGLVQDGNDMWDATFFCGSCAVLRRSALDAVGGIAVETVTEDAHTSLRLHRKGYTSAYIRIPQAAGLATESLSAHIGQRIRWARGMVQIFRLDNPLFGKGLKLVQRLCYANAMLHFLSGIPRLIFLTAPLAFLLLHAYIIFAPALAIALYVLPHMIHASLTNSRLQGKYRHSFWSEIYETVLAWYIARPTTVALLNPHKGTFNVTAKGGLVEEQHVDWVITRPYITLVLLNLAGLIAGLWRLGHGPSTEIMTVIISLVWVIYNMTILGGAVAVAVEAKQVRQSHRVEIAMPAAVARADGHLFSCTLLDYSDGGVGIEMREAGLLKDGEAVQLLLKRGAQEYTFPCEVTRAFGTKVGMRMHQLTVAQHIDFIQCTFARADTWALWQDGFPEDKPIESLRDVLALGFRGYVRMASYAPPVIRNVLVGFTSLIAWIASFVPHGVDKNQAPSSQGQTVAQH